MHVSHPEISIYPQAAIDGASMTALQQHRLLSGPRSICQSGRPARSAGRKECRCQAQPNAHFQTGRRELLLAGTAALGASLWVPERAQADIDYKETIIGVNGLSTFQRAGQKAELADRATRELKKVLKADDSGIALKALLHDAATYDVATGQGGVNGSIFFDEELRRSENKGIKPYIDKLKQAKKAIDEGGAAVGQGPVSYADLLALGVKVTATLTWAAIKIKRATIQSGGDTIASAFGAAYPLQLGRVDATEPDPPAKDLPGDDASPEEVQAFFLKLANSKPQGGGFLAGKAPFWEKKAYILYTGSRPNLEAAEARLGQSKAFASFKQQYDRSKATVTRTDYEVDYIEFQNQLSRVGAKFDSDAYLHPLTLRTPRKL